MAGRVFHVRCLHDGREYAGERDVCVEDGRVSAILEPGRGNAGGLERIECGGFMVPGLVNSHHHAYSALARSIPVAAPMPDFPSRLRELWWRVDRALGLEDVRVSALVTATECISHGCTSVIDHHSSQAAVRGSLEQVARGFGEAGVRCVTCFETSDRNGPEAAAQAVEENLEFAGSHEGHPRARGMFGLHASFTLGDGTLERIARLKPPGMPVHVHVAEDLCDVEHARGLGHDGPLSRLHAFGLLAPGSIVAHGVHLGEAERRLARDLWLAHNPESNLGNRVGYGDPDGFEPGRVLLGTDGMTSSMLTSLRSAFLAYSALGGRASAPLELAVRILLENPARCLSEVFGRPVGRIAAGEEADLAVFPYEPPPRVDGSSWPGHLVYALTCSPRASWVYAAGRPVVEEGRVSAVDVREVMREARERSRALWRRFGEA